MRVSELFTFRTREGMGSVSSVPLKLNFDCVSVCCHSNNNADAQGWKRERKKKKNTDEEDGAGHQRGRWGRWWWWWGIRGSRTSENDSK